MKMGSIGNEVPSGSIADFYSGRSVFITGTTGFVGKVLLEKLLYSCEGIDKVYILVREKTSASASQRVQSITSCELFTRLKEKRPSDINKIIPVEGDIAAPGLGLRPDVEREILENVSIVIHSAATIKFNEPLKHAYNINVEGTRRILELCHKIENIKAFVHVSTAYSHTDKAVIEEVVYPPLITVDEFDKLMNKIPREFTAEETKEILKFQPNTYTFTKALAESLVKDNHGSIPTVIVRPSIVTAAADEPLQGWIENWNGASGLLYVSCQGYHRAMLGNSGYIADIIPVNYVTNLIIVAAARAAASNNLKIYNSCSSSSNPITWGNLVHQYLNGSKKDNSMPRLLIPAFLYFTKSRFLVRVIDCFLLLIPAYIADIISKVVGGKSNNIRKLLKIRALRTSLEYFTSSSWIWKTDNLQALTQTLTASDLQTFPCYPADLDWPRYVSNYAAGVNKYLVKKKV